MTTRYFATAIITALLAATAGAQSPTDLLQKGIYAQETLGDLDGAIQIYRQITAANSPKQTAAQAQYQLVLCMLQKGDRGAASHELDTLTHNYPEQQDLINRARKLIPGASTLLAPPWGEGEASQLNIKRDGAFTGEYLYYFASPWRNTVPSDQRDPARTRDAVDYAQAIYLAWKLHTNTSTRSVIELVDRDTMRRLKPNSFNTEGSVEDPSATPFAGPAIDAEPLVFRLRVLPLAVGYKTTLTTLPFLLGHGVPKQVELAVSGVEAVQTLAGKFNCYKVDFASLGQTFWIGVDGARPLVKFQSGSVEAELVKTWGPQVLDDTLGFLKKAGWSIRDAHAGLMWGGGIEWDEAYSSSPQGGPYGSPGIAISMHRIYTPPESLEKAIHQNCANPRTRTVGGHPSLTCSNDTTADVWLGTSSFILHITANGNNMSAAVFLWLFEPILDTIQLPKD